MTRFLQEPSIRHSSCKYGKGGSQKLCPNLQVALALLGVKLYTTEFFKQKGGKGHVRSWASVEASKLRALAAHVVRLNHRTDVARNPKMMVLKKILAMANAPSEPQLMYCKCLSPWDLSPNLLLQISAI